MSREIDMKILRKLEEWKRDESVLPDMLRLYEDLLQIQCEAKSNIVLHGVPQDEVMERLEQGMPILSFADLHLDWAITKDLLHQAITIFAERLFLPTDRVDLLRDIVFDDERLQPVVEAYYNVKDVASLDLEVETELLFAVIQTGLWPVLSMQSELLLPQVEQLKWRKRYCPICGGKADFAFLTGETGERWLSCSRCDAEWLFQRLECPFCGTRDQTKLAYFTDEEEVYRMYTCSACQTYIKAIDIRKTTGEVLLPFEKIATIDLDNQALIEGFHPGTQK